MTSRRLIHNHPQRNVLVDHGDANVSARKNRDAALGDKLVLGDPLHINARETRDAIHGGLESFALGVKHRLERPLPHCRCTLVIGLRQEASAQNRICDLDIATRCRA